MLPENRFTGPEGATDWPIRYTDDDFITDMLSKLPWQWRQGACTKYSKVYLCDGRAAANKWLRNGVRDHI
jgi:hypothetical protein